MSDTYCFTGAILSIIGRLGEKKKKKKKTG